MTAGLIPAGEGSDRLTADRLALIGRWAETFGLDPANPYEAAMLQQEAQHVAELVEAAWRAGYGQGRDDEAAGENMPPDFPPGCVCHIREDPDRGEVYTRPDGRLCPVHDCTCDLPLRCRVHADPPA